MGKVMSWSLNGVESAFPFWKLVKIILQLFAIRSGYMSPTRFTKVSASKSTILRECDKSAACSGV